VNTGQYQQYPAKVAVILARHGIDRPDIVAEIVAAAAPEYRPTADDADAYVSAMMLEAIGQVIGQQSGVILRHVDGEVWVSCGGLFAGWTDLTGDPPPKLSRLAAALSRVSVAGCEQVHLNGGRPRVYRLPASLFTP
jgi:hypothetical protein